MVQRFERGWRENRGALSTSQGSGCVVGKEVVMDRARLVAFVQEEYPRVVAAVDFACGDRGWAEDAVQEVLAAALGRTETVTNLRSWVITSALNRVRSGARSRAAEVRALERAGQLLAPDNDSEIFVVDDLLHAMRQLSAGQREATALHYLLDMSVAETAGALDLSEGTVKTQLHRARESLRTQLGPDTAVTAAMQATTETTDEEDGHVHG